MAWTGIASTILPKGMTSHRTFRLPLNLSEVECIYFKHQSDKQKLIDADILIWDEASMVPKIEIHHLRNNMRTKNIPLIHVLLKIGEGKINEFEIPKHWKTNDVCETIYRKSTTNSEINKVNLVSHNEEAMTLNNNLIS